MNNKCYFIPLFFFFLVGCDFGSSDNEKIIVTIGSAPKICHPTWEYATLCSPSVIDTSGVHRSLDAVVGFEYAFGTEYELLLEVIEIKEPPADTYGYEYRILRIVREDKDPIGTTYVYEQVSLTNDAVVFVEDGVYSLPPYEFLCADDVNCDTLVDMANSGGVVSIELTMTGGAIPVTITNWN